MTRLRWMSSVIGRRPRCLRLSSERMNAEKCLFQILPQRWRNLTRARTSNTTAYPQDLWSSTIGPVVFIPVMRSLTMASFDWNACEVTIHASDSKHRQQDVVPLRSNTSPQLRTMLVGQLPGAKAFDLPSKHTMLRC